MTTETNPFAAAEFAPDAARNEGVDISALLGTTLIGHQPIAFTIDERGN